MAKWSMAPRPPMRRRSPMIASGGTSKTLRATPPTQVDDEHAGVVALRLHREHDLDAEDVAVPGREPVEVGLSVATWLKPVVMGTVSS